MVRRGFGTITIHIGKCWDSIKVIVVIKSNTANNNIRSELGNMTKAVIACNVVALIWWLHVTWLNQEVEP